MLRGLNRSGLEYSPRPIPWEEIARIRALWGANILRIPFNQDWVLNGWDEGTSGDYLHLLDSVIDGAAQQGIYTLLDLQWLDAKHSFGPDRQFVAPLPNPETPRLWSLLARRYGANPSVLFDLLNEPHDRLANDPYPLHRPDGSRYPPEHRRVSMAEWRPWALHLIDVIRAEAPDTLLFVSGTNWGYDLRGFPLDRPNLVYSTHVYRNKTGFFWKRGWREAFGRLARHAPVFAAEFGGGERDLRWGHRLLHYFDELAIGWTAWSLTDHPHLATPTGQPTPFGALVRERLANPTIKTWTSS